LKKSVKMGTSFDLHILDSDVQHVESICNIIYWNDFTSSEQDGIFSIPQLVEENANFLKANYLKLIYDFGEVKINDRRIIDRLMIRSNFSYWWSTLLSEKCNFAKSPQIDNIIKLMALELWLKQSRYRKIKLTTSNRELATSLSLLTKKMSIDFDCTYKKNIKSSVSILKRVFYTLPDMVKSPIWLLHYFYSNLALKGVGSEEWRNTSATTTFVSYLFNLNPGLAEQGKYKSSYWTTLTDLISNNQHSTNWLHIYIKDSLLPSAKEARELIRRFNHVSNGNQVHVTLASFLSVPIFFHTLKDWRKILKLKKLIGSQLEVNSGYLWPLFKKDYQESISGISAMNNLLYLNLFDKAMCELPIQDRGCYLQENQGWEFGFIATWRLAGHGENLIGIPHSTVRYWDLRYFFDSRTYKNRDNGGLPLPGHIGVNGKSMKKVFIEGGYPENILIELEALRYLYLADCNTRQVRVSGSPSKNKVVLVLTDYLKNNTDKQLKLLTSALKYINKSTLYIIKSHPAHKVNLKDFPDINGSLSTDSISKLLGISDIVYSSSSTSGAVDAYCSSLPVIILKDGDVLNQSPLRGCKDVFFSSNAEDLADKINSLSVIKSQGRVDYFYLDTNLKKWSDWINSNT
jgi:surface carbohydrate biosynthesis protein (TIGR04326 family)